jgi:hypothetical protein
VPTIQVSRRKRMTPKIFCRQGRYTPMRVPMLGAYVGRRGAQGIRCAMEGSPTHSAAPHLYLQWARGVQEVAAKCLY